MQYHFEATETYLNKLDEISNLETLLSYCDDNMRNTLLKLIVVGIVTRFQVYIETILSDFRYKLQHNNVKSSRLNDFIKLNAVFMQLNKEDDAIKKFKTGNKNLLDLRDSIIEELKSFQFLYETTIIDDSFCFNTNFPLGKTGTGDLLKLLKQFDGDESPFEHDFEDKVIDKSKLDSMLGIRNAIVHQDIFNGTEQDIKNMLETCKDFGLYLDEYIYQKSKNYLVY